MDSTLSKPQPTLGILYAINFVFSASFLLLVPIATKAGPSNQGWWTQPALMPSLALGLMVLSSAYLLLDYGLKLRANRDLRADKKSVKQELTEWLKPFEFFIYYCLYIWLLGLIGYFLSSLVFIVILSFRVGLRSAKWMLIAFLTALALVALFRWGLKVWVPVSDLYGLFPKNIRIFLMRNF